MEQMLGLPGSSLTLKLDFYNIFDKITTTLNIIMANSLASAGIGSGLDVSSIVSKLMTLEQAPLTRLQTKATSIQTQVSLYGQLKSAYSNLQSSLQAFSNESNRTQLLGLQSTSSDTSVASATITKSVPSGSYALNVTSLAASQQLLSSAITDPNADITTSAASISVSLGSISGGTLDSTLGTYSGATFTTESTKTFSVPAGTSLNELRDLINQSKSGVNATVISDGTKYYLALNGAQSGVKNSVSISSTGDAALSNFITQDPQGTQKFKQTSAASNLNATLNGLSVSSPKNNLTDNIAGLTINVSKIGSATINVTTNSSGPSGLLNSVVNNWNALNTLSRQLTNYDPSTKKSGPLIGDSLVNTTMNTVRQQLFGSSASSSSSANPNYNSLLQIGLNIDSKGVASLDAAKLTKALQADPDSIVNLFSNSSGAANITQKAQSTLTNLLGASTGFQSKINVLNDQLKANQKQQSILQNRLAVVQENLTRQYNTLDTTISNLQQISSSLTSSLSAISNSSY